jgi:hypothetical protein
MKGYGHYRSLWLLLILLILGGIFGSLIGQALGGFNHLAVLNQGPYIGIAPPTTLDLNFLTITFGFTFKVNPVSFLGFIVAFLAYLRL